MIRARSVVCACTFALCVSSCTPNDSQTALHDRSDSAPKAVAKQSQNAAAKTISTNASGTTIPSDLIAAREAVWRAYFAGDSALLVTLLPDPMIGMDETRAQIIANSQQFARDGGKLIAISFTHDEFSATADMAVLYSRYRARLDTRGKQSTDSGQAIELFVKRDGKWINPSWHLHRVGD